MLFVIVPAAWFSVLLVLAGICRAAAEGDARQTATAGPREGSIGVKLTLTSRATTARSPRLRARSAEAHRRARARRARATQELCRR
jgi:hypothetical protein